MSPLLKLPRAENPTFCPIESFVEMLRQRLSLDVLSMVEEGQAKRFPFSVSSVCKLPSTIVGSPFASGDGFLIEVLVGLLPDIF